MAMRPWLSRLAGGVVVLIVAATLNFALPRLAPGDPVEYVFGGETQDLTTEQLDALRTEYRVAGSPLEQYARYWSDLVRGDLGTSISHGRPVSDILWERLPWTAGLVGVSIVLSTVVGTMFGVYAAFRRGSRRDGAMTTTLLTVDSMPSFWVAMILIAVFSVRFGWFPSYGGRSLVDQGGAVAQWFDIAKRMVLPAAALILSRVGSTFLLARGSMLTVVSQPYVAMAEAKGLSRRRVAYHHALRNALLPLSTMFALSLGALVSGAVVVETVFAYPGVGRTVFEAVSKRDYPLLQGGFLLLTVAVVVTNLVADLVYPLLDPRARRPSGAEA